MTNFKATCISACILAAVTGGQGRPVLGGEGRCGVPSHELLHYRLTRATSRPSSELCSAIVNNISRTPANIFREISVLCWRETRPSVGLLVFCTDNPGSTERYHQELVHVLVDHRRQAQAAGGLYLK